MKYTWEVKDIERSGGGLWFGLPEDFGGESKTSLDFLVSRTYKLGFCGKCRYDTEPDKNKRKPSEYCMVAITDGAIYGHAGPEDFVNMLNKNGYVPLYGEELCRRLMHKMTRSQL